MDKEHAIDSATLSKLNKVMKADGFGPGVPLAEEVPDLDDNLNDISNASLSSRIEQLKQDAELMRELVFARLDELERRVGPTRVASLENLVGLGEEHPGNLQDRVSAASARIGKLERRCSERRMENMCEELERLEPRISGVVYGLSHRIDNVAKSLEVVRQQVGNPQDMQSREWEPTPPGEIAPLCELIARVDGRLWDLENTVTPDPDSDAKPADPDPKFANQSDWVAQAIRELAEGRTVKLGNETFLLVPQSTLDGMDPEEESWA